MNRLLMVYAAMSMVTIVVYAIDEYKAKMGLWRTPKNIAMLELCCGWTNAMLAHKFMRHKSYKNMFRIVFWVMVVVNVTMVSIVLDGRKS